MTFQPTSILVTGGAGFIGSNYINSLNPDQIVIVNVDCLDYCADPLNVEEKIRNHPNYHFFHLDIRETLKIGELLEKYRVDTLVHFAAQSHVDNSFTNTQIFTEANVLGTQSLLEACRTYGKIQRFINFSTDEVLGSAPEELISGFTETQCLNPTNPYAASKAGAEVLGIAYMHSYKIPIITTRCNNVYGPRQYPEKLIARYICHLLQGKKLPVHGNGQSRRMFIYVEDVCSAVNKILAEGTIGEIYHIATGTENEYSVLQMAELLIGLIQPGTSDWLEFCTDRAYNDSRYFLNCDKLKTLGWKPETDFATGLAKTIEWYKI